VRVFVKSGGCSGYSYGMAIDDQRLEGDRVFADGGARVVVDPKSWPLLRGAEIDYVENMMGGGFHVTNPNATSACGCGSSFRTDGRAAPDGESELLQLTPPLDPTRTPAAGIAAGVRVSGTAARVSRFAKACLRIGLRAAVASSRRRTGVCRGAPAR
jgi:iron-sulfur cluster assembly accessory protein